MNCQIRDCKNIASLEIKQLDMELKPTKRMCVEHFLEFYAFAHRFSINKENKLVKIRDASILLGVHPETLRRWDRSGRLKAVRMGTGGHRRYRVVDLLNFL